MSTAPSPNPCCYLFFQGEQGVTNVLQMLRDELKVAMAIAGLDEHFNLQPEEQKITISVARSCRRSPDICRPGCKDQGVFYAISQDNCF